MTYGPGWPPPPPPQPPARKYAPKWIWLGVAAGTAVTIGFSFLGLVLATTVQQGAAASIVFLIGLLTPLVIGIVLTVKEGPPPRRGFGLGLIIGWAIAPIVFAGLCILVIVGAYTVPNIGG